MSFYRYTLLLIAMVFWRYLIATFLPLGHDEVYYWDWASYMDWGYFDHPAGVAVLSYLNQMLASSYLGARFLNPLIHIFCSLLIFRSAELLKGSALSNFQILFWFALTQTVPYFHIGSVSLMPDIPLLLFCSLFLERAVYAVKEENPASYNYALLGLLLGLGFNSKYHAIVLLGMMAFSAFIFEKKFRKVSSLSLFLIGLVIGIFPVFYWNYMNDFTSFKFQTNHGFADLKFKALFFFQTTIAQIVLFGPFLILGIPTLIKQFKNYKESKSYLLLGSVVLVLLLAVLGFYKKILPHWVLPAIWMMLPWLIVYETKKYIKFQMIYGLSLSLILSIAVLVTPLRQGIISQILHNKPGGLGEMTMWEPLSREFDKSGIWEDLDNNRDIMLGFRWFDTSHLSFENPNSKRVYNFDMYKPSFYYFRDGTDWWYGKSFIAVTVNNNIPNGFRTLANIESEESIYLEDHQDRKVKVYRGKFLTKDAVGELGLKKTDPLCKSYLTESVCRL